MLLQPKKCKKANTKAWVDNVKTEPFLAQEPKGGKIESTTKNEKFDYTEYVLSNGAKVIVKKTNFKNDEILTYAESNGGSSIRTGIWCIARLLRSYSSASPVSEPETKNIWSLMQGSRFYIRLSAVSACLY